MKSRWVGSTTYSKRPAPVNREEEGNEFSDMGHSYIRTSHFYLPSKADTRTKRLLPWIPGFVVKNALASGFELGILSFFLFLPFRVTLTSPDTTHWQLPLAASTHASIWLSSHSSSSSRMATKQSWPKAEYASRIPVFQGPNMFDVGKRRGEKICWATNNWANLMITFNMNISYAHFMTYQFQNSLLSDCY